MVKYKVGDKVKVKSLEWYEKNRNSNGDINTSGNCFVRDMSLYCGKEATITQTGIGLGYGNYQIDIDEGDWCWPEESFEDISDKEPSTIYTYLANAINKVVTEHHQPVMIEEIDGGIIIKPIEKEEYDLPIGTLVACSNNKDYWAIGVYKGYRSVSFRIDGEIEPEYRNYIIPLNLFSNDIEESLKHNIVKHG